MKIFNYIKTVKENKQLKEEIVQQNRLINDLTEQVRDYKTRNTKHLKTIKELKQKLKERND